MDSKNNFAELEKQAKSSAERLIVESFQRYEDLDKIPQLKKRYKSQAEATEAQLKLVIQIQLDGVKDGLEKLDYSFNECCDIRTRMDEVSSKLVNIKSLSDGLESLQVQCRSQKQLAAAMDNMDYLVKVPEIIKQATALIDSENFLHAHKIIEELEGTRDEIMRELYRQDNGEADLRIIGEFFSDVNTLNEKMLRHIQFMGERVINAIISQNVILVNCIRIIDREERTDEAWINRKSNNDFMPPSRPKQWKEKFFSKVRRYINEKIFESALDEEVERNFLTRHLEAIRCHTIHDLKVIKNIGVVYFPFQYRVFETFVKMYHEEISAYVLTKADRLLDEVESFQLLGWMNHYHGGEFMGSPELGINFNKIDVSNVQLLSVEQFDKLAYQYLERQRSKLQSWFYNCVNKDAEGWECDQQPQCDGACKFNTSLSIDVLKPLTEMLAGSDYFINEQEFTTFNFVDIPQIGRDKVLYHLGEKIRERYFPMFLEEFAVFQTNFTKELNNYKDKYSKQPIPLSLEYLIANCNNCIKIKSDVEEIIRKDLDNSPSIQVKIDFMLQKIGKDMLNIAQLCLDFIKEMLYKDLYKVLSNVMGEDWTSGVYKVDDYIIGTVADYNNTLIYLKDIAYRRLIAALIEQIIVEYVKNLLIRRVNLNQEERKKVGNRIYNDGDKLNEYFTKEMNLDTKITSCVQVITLIAQLLLNSDTGMIRLDINTLIKVFPGIRKDQLISLLMLRGDIKLIDAKEIAADYNYCSVDDKTNIFMKVAMAMGQS